MTVLTKEEVLKELRKHTLIAEGRIIFKVLDYSGNSLAPSRVAYRVTYPDYSGKRSKVTYWPGTVGFQWS